MLVTKNNSARKFAHAALYYNIMLCFCAAWRSAVKVGWPLLPAPV